MDLHKLDLNLLKTLLVLLQENNTHKAAERLNVSQPAVSKSLKKLRAEFDDPLFVRHHRGLKPTQRGEELAKLLPDVFASLESAIQGTKFNPSLLNGKFKLALNGFVMEIYGGEIYKQLKQACPDLDIELHSYGPHTASELLTGEIDIAINFYPLNLSKQLYQKKITQLTFGLISRKDLICAENPTTLAHIIELPLVGLIIPEFNTSTMLVNSFLDTNTITPVFRSQQISPILENLRTDDYYFVAPKTLMNKLDSKEFHFTEVKDDELRHQISIAIIYNSRYWNSAKYQWLETLLLSCLK